MVKMNNHLEPEDFQISKLNEFFLVADRIRKAGRSVRQGFGKLKRKPNPNGGGARLSVSKTFFGMVSLAWNCKNLEPINRLGR
jgi:hypothetical protein